MNAWQTLILLCLATAIEGSIGGQDDPVSNLDAAVLGQSTRATSSCNCTTPIPTDCYCPNGDGIITFAPNFQDETLIHFDELPSGTMVMITVNKSDIIFPERECSFIINSHDIGEDEVEYLHDTNFFYLTTPDTISLTNEPGLTCEITMYYSAVEPNLTTITIPSDNFKGTIQGPENSTTQDYLFQQRIKWNFNYDYDYIVTFNITRLDLGYRNGYLHGDIDNEVYNEVHNDMLFIGIEDATGVQGTVYLFYGRANESKQVQVNSPYPFITFYGTYHETPATGFQIDYQAYETPDFTTTTPVSTTTLPSFGAAPTSEAAVNNVLQDNSQYTLVEEFQNTIAPMATDYITITNLSVADPQNVQPAEVDVSLLQECISTVCQENCVNFVFSINKFNRDQTDWAFSTSDLNAMLKTEELQHYWNMISSTAGLCDESVQLNWWLIGGVIAFMIFFTVLASLFVCKLTEVTSEKQEEKTTAKINQEEELEKRRRSSGDASLIGTRKGGVKMSLPFTTRLRDSLVSSVSSFNEEQYDTSGFADYDTDFGYEDFGMRSDSIPPPMGQNFYSNAAYEPDSSPHLYSQIYQKPIEPFQVEVFQPSTSKVHEPNLEGLPIKSSMKKTANPQPKPSAMKMTKFDCVEEEDSDEEDSDGALEFTKGMKLSLTVEENEESAL